MADPPHRRVDGRAKVTGRARFTADTVIDRLAVVVPVPATIAKGRILTIDASEALATKGVLAVVSPDNAPTLGSRTPPDLLLFQNWSVAYRGQFVAGVVATTEEVAAEAAGTVQVTYAPEAAELTFTAEDQRRYRPRRVNAGYESDTSTGDVERALATAAVHVDEVYQTPMQHSCAMEPHATIARWDDGGLTLYDTCQGPTWARDLVADIFELPPTQVRVISQHIGGGFGGKGLPRVNAVLAAVAAQTTGRAVACVLDRRHTFMAAGHRSATIQRVRLGADRGGQILALAHDATLQTSTIDEFAEQAAAAPRHMYAAPNRRTTHRLVRLNTRTPSWVRAPGAYPGMFALESAMDELAHRCSIDPVALRIRNLARVHPDIGTPLPSRQLAACLREGARIFGWRDRQLRAGPLRRDGRLVGSGVAAATYPAEVAASSAEAVMDSDGRYRVEISAADLGTGARTALVALAAETLGVAPGYVDVRIGDSRLPPAMVAGGSMGTASWGWAVIEACRKLRARLSEHRGALPEGGLRSFADTSEAVRDRPAAPHYSYGAQFVEVEVDTSSGEVRVSEMLGVFATGRILLPSQARSQFIGGMAMGLSGALLEHSYIDHAHGGMLGADLTGYHVATNADVPDIQVRWIEEIDDVLGPAGLRGVGEIGIVGTAAAIANAVFHATGVRVRSLPIRPEALLAPR